MKKIAVLTLSNSTNYGGILQAVALNYKLKSLGYSPVYIQHQTMTKPWISAVSYVKTRVELYGAKGFNTKLRIIGGICKTIISNKHFFRRKTKINNFQNFINRNLNTTDYYATIEDLKDNCSDFELYIVGSDQVWNNTFTHNKFDEAYFLTFANPNAKKYSYAASVGGAKSDEYIYELIEFTKDFKGISVREDSLRVHMNSLGCECAVTVLDPTLLLTKDEWKCMEKKPVNPHPEHYILVYYLEKESYNDKLIKTISEKFNLPVININPDSKRAKYNSIYDHTAGPGEFVYYIDNADYVITNSFHATVFSLIFNKNFVVVPREGQESRVEDLLKKIKMENHIISKIEDWEVINSPAKDISNTFDEAKEVSLSFLKNMGD